MGDAPRMTLPTLSVLSSLLERRSDLVYGLEIAKATDLKSGTLYPILARLERAGWVESSWENVAASEAGRPRRRYYRLTGEGAESAINALSEASRRLRPGLLRPSEGFA